MSSNADVVRQVYDGFAAGDIDTVLSTMDPAIAWTEADGFPYAGTYTGPDAIVEGVFARLASEWDGYAAVPSEFIDSGERVVALGRYSGTYKATGKSFEAPFAHVYTVRDGKITDFVQYTDTKLVDAALT